jgi:hypothetical protein
LSSKKILAILETSPEQDLSEGGLEILEIGIFTSNTADMLCPEDTVYISNF